MNGKSAVEKWWHIFREFLCRIRGLFKKWTGLILKYLKIVKKIFKSECKSVFFTNSSFLCSLGLLTVSPHCWIVKSNHICLLKIHWARKLNRAHLHNCTYPLHMFLLAINYYDGFSSRGQATLQNSCAKQGKTLSEPSPSSLLMNKMKASRPLVGFRWLMTIQDYYD